MSPNELKTELNPRSWGLDRILLVLTLCATVLGGASVVFNWGGKYVEMNKRQDRIDERVLTLETNVKDRKAEVEASFAALRTGAEANLSAMRTQDKGFDDRLDDVENTVSRLSDRQSATDARLGELAAGQRDVLTLLNQLNADTSAMRAVLARIEAAQTGSRK